MIFWSFVKNTRVGGNFEFLTKYRLPLLFKKKLFFVKKTVLSELGCELFFEIFPLATCVDFEYFEFAKNVEG